MAGNIFYYLKPARTRASP